MLLTGNDKSVQTVIFAQAGQKALASFATSMEALIVTRKLTGIYSTSFVCLYMDAM